MPLEGDYIGKKWLLMIHLRDSSLVAVGAFYSKQTEISINRRGGDKRAAAAAGEVDNGMW